MVDAFDFVDWALLVAGAYMLVGLGYGFGWRRRGHHEVVRRRILGH